MVAASLQRGRVSKRTYEPLDSILSRRSDSMNEKVIHLWVASKNKRHHPSPENVLGRNLATFL